MVAIDRDTLSSGEYLQSFKDMPGMEWWSAERIEDSMQGMLACRPAGKPVWLFAYGSLIWNPQFHFVENVPALLQGWRRSFCMRLVAGRGSIDRPGRMLSLAPGGQTHGFALRLDETILEQELRMVWLREMVGGTYRPGWEVLDLEDGRSVSAIVFTAKPDCPMHEEDDSLDAITPLIAGARGAMGSNQEYVLQLDTALRTHGIQDPYIHDLAEKLKQLTA